jgi:hypothetical protein
MGSMGVLVEKGRGSWQRNVVIIHFNELCFWGREDEDKKLEKLFFFLGGGPNCPFWACIIKINTFTFWCMVIPLGSHLVYT